MRTILLTSFVIFLFWGTTSSQSLQPFNFLGLQISGCNGDRDGELIFLYTHCGFAVDSLVVRLDSTYGVYSDRNDFFINAKNEVCKWKEGDLSVFEGCTNLHAAGAGDYIPPGSLVVIQMTSDMTTISSLAKTCEGNVPIYVIANDCIRTDEAFPIHGVRKDSFGILFQLLPDFELSGPNRYYVAYAPDQTIFNRPLNLYDSYPGSWGGYFYCDTLINMDLADHAKKLLPKPRVIQASCDASGSIEIPIQSSRYSVDGGNTWSSDSLFENLVPGEYLPAVWDDQSNCQVTWLDSVTIKAYYPPEFLTIWWWPVSDTICEGATANLYPEFRNSENGHQLDASLYEFSIDSGLTYQDSMMFNGLVEGSFNLAVRDKANTQCVVHYHWDSPPLPKRPDILGLARDSIGSCESPVIELMADGEDLLYSADGINFTPDSLVTVIPDQPFTAYVKSRENDYCIDSLEVKVNQAKEFMVDVVVDSQSASSILTSPSKGPYTLEWSTGDSISEVENLPTGPNWLMVTDGWGCTQRIEFNIVVCSFEIRDSITHVSCESPTGSIYLLHRDTNRSFTYDWNIDSYDGLPYVEGVISGMYMVLISDSNGCTYRDTFSITNDIEVPIASPDISVLDCDNSIYQIDFSKISGGTGPFEVIINDISYSDLTISDLSPGDYSWKVKDSNGCTSADSLISLTKVPEIQILNSDTTISAGSPIFLSATGDIDLIKNYNWVFPTGYCNCTDTLLLSAPEGLYNFNYSGLFSRECNVHRRFHVTYTEDEIFIPNSITPNDDGNNDVFEIFAPNHKIIRLQIFNRWGSEVYRTTGPEFFWDGKMGRFGSSQGTYLYLIELENRQGIKTRKNGTLVVLK